MKNNNNKDSARTFDPNPRENEISVLDEDRQPKGYNDANRQQYRWSNTLVCGLVVWGSTYGFPLLRCSGVLCWPSQGGTSALSPLSCSFLFFLARFIAVMSTVSTCLVCNSSIVATCPSIPAAHFAFCLFYSLCFSCL